MGLNSTPRTWVPGEVTTAAQLNAEIRDALAGLQAPWDTYTPTWTAATTAPSLGNGSLAGRYRQVGKTVDVLIRLVIGSTTGLGLGNWNFTLPVAAKGGIGSTLHVAAAISGTVNSFMGFTAELSGASTGTLFYPNQGLTGDWNAITGGAPSGWASGDTLRVFGRYETT